MILQLVIILLLADFSTPASPKTVINHTYTPLLLLDVQNVLFAPKTATMCSLSKCGVSPAVFSMVISHKIYKHHLFTKSMNTVIILVLLLLSGDIEKNPGPTGRELSEPPAKRLRTAICLCSKCNGQERDFRTVNTHMKEVFESQLAERFESSQPSPSPPSPQLSPKSSSCPELSPEPSPELSLHLTSTEPLLDDNRSTEPLLGSSSTSYEFSISEVQIQKFILKEVKVKLDHGHSVATTEEHLKNAAELLGGGQIPTKWSAVIHYLKSLGYKDPKHYKVCVSNDHSCLLKAEELSCRVCSKPSVECLDYYVLGLNFKDWFLTNEQCERLMAHWNERDDWLDKCSTYKHSGMTELWHGERFRQLSWFWNPQKEYILPDWCPFCHVIIPASVIQDCYETNTHITCHGCSKCFPAMPRKVKGDPRNQALIIHEDGWNCFSTSQSSMAAITITHACMNKLDRSSAKYSHVYSFIPTDQLPRDAPHKYDAFFEPLIDELEYLFIEGEQVFFSKKFSDVGCNDSCPTLRAIPLLITADSKAHHEIGLTSAGGHKGCRRCQVCGVYVPEKRHYYFGGFQRRYWTPCSLRTVLEDRENGRAADKARSNAERKRICKETGVTGESIFYRLYDLCGLNPIKDLTIDAMHAIVLNLIRSELELLLADLGSNSGLPPAARDPSNGGLLDRSSLKNALDAIQWTTELKDGRLPVFCKDGQKLSYWKAEEFSKFIVVAPFVLRELIPRKAYDSFCLLKDMYCLVYSKQLRIEGWHQEHHEYFKQLLWKHVISFEEVYGLASCTENLEYSLHMPEDIKRHSLLDNYWCYLYERQVKYYKHQTSNMKSLCKSFADRANLLHFTSVLLCTHKTTTVNHESKFPCLLCKPLLLTASSVEQAIELKEYLSSSDDSSSEQCLSLKFGIFLGKSTYISLSEQELSDIQYWLRDLTGQKFPTVCQAFSRIFKVSDFDLGCVYRTNEHVIVRDNDDENTEWLVKIENFLVYGPVSGSFHYYLKGKFYAAKTVRDAIEYDTWTGCPKMILKDYRRLCTYPLALLKRKVMIYPADETMMSYLVIDPDHPVFCQEITIPYYPKINEVVRVMSAHLNSPMLMLVKQVHHDTHIFEGHKLQAVRGSCRYSILSRITCAKVSDVLCCVPYRLNAGCVYVDNCD